MYGYQGVNSQGSLTNVGGGGGDLEMNHHAWPSWSGGGGGGMYSNILSDGSEVKYMKFIYLAGI